MSAYLTAWERSVVDLYCREDLARAQRHARRALAHAAAGRLDYAEGSRAKMEKNLHRAERTATRWLGKRINFAIVTRDDLATS